jgi:hypothetical protein
MRGITLSLPLAALLTACPAARPDGSGATDATAYEEPICGGVRTIYLVTSSSQLDFGLSLDPSSTGSQVVLRFAIQNVSTTAMALRPKVGLDQQRDREETIRLELLRVSPSSEPAPSCVLRKAPASEPYFELDPGDRFTFEAEVDCDRPLDEGRWRIVARYVGRGAGPTHYHPSTRQPLFDHWFAGTLESNAMEISVAPGGSVSALRPEEVNLCDPWLLSE